MPMEIAAGNEIMESGLGCVFLLIEDDNFTFLRNIYEFVILTPTASEAGGGRSAQDEEILHYAQDDNVVRLTG